MAGSRPVASQPLTPHPRASDPALQAVAAPYAGELLELNDARAQGSLLLGQLQAQAQELGQAAAAMPLRVQARWPVGAGWDGGWTGHCRPRPASCKQASTSSQRRSLAHQPSQPWPAQPLRPPPPTPPPSQPCLPQKIESTMALLETGDLKLRVRVLEAERAARRAGVIQVRAHSLAGLACWRARVWAGVSSDACAGGFELKR